MRKFFKKYIDSIVPLFSIIPLLSCFGLNMLVYSGCITLTSNWYHYDFTTSFDRAVPLVPQWMYIYFGCYLFWIINYIMVARCHRDNHKAFYQFVTTDMMSRLVCAVFFILLPTTNVRPEVPDGGFSHLMLGFLYSIDPPANLFPSIHCLVSWLCFAGIRKSKQVPLWYKVFSCIFALLVVISTQFTKQHYIVDAIAGLTIAEGLFFLNKRIHLYQYVQRFFTWLNYKIFAE